MTTFTPVEAKPQHCGMMLRRMRLGHREAISGVAAHREFRQRFDESAYRRAWMLDGHLAALGGISGTALSVGGFVWLAVSDEAARHPAAMARAAKAYLEELAEMRRVIRTVILLDDEASLQFAIFLGFTLPGHEAASSRSWRRMIFEEVMHNHELRLRAGSGYAVLMEYR